MVFVCFLVERSIYRFGTWLKKTRRKLYLLHWRRLKKVLSLLPPYEGKSVVELGAGIGRCTGELAKKAGQVLALDFIESGSFNILHFNEAWIYPCLVCYILFYISSEPQYQQKDKTDLDTFLKLILHCYTLYR